MESAVASPTEAAELERMMHYLKITLFASWGGLLFTSIILGSKLFTEEWAAIEPYPFFLWFPSWWVCFTLFAVIFVVTTAAGKNRVEYGLAAAANGIVAFLGSLLTGRFLMSALIDGNLNGRGMDYIVLFPWSLYAFVLFAMLFAFSSAYLLFGAKEEETEDGKTADRESEEA